MSVPSLQPNPFTQAVVDAMRRLYPEELADRSWDNVGLLLENTAPPPDSKLASRTSVLLTNDLTEGVVNEAITLEASVIISYHPPIFRPLKSITLSDPQQHLLLKLVQHNIAVYSPHTALDAAPGGLNDWLADVATSWAAEADPDVTCTRAAIKPVPFPSAATAPLGAGYGRTCTFSRPVGLRGLLAAVGSTLGSRRGRYLSVASPPGTPDGAVVTTVAVCAGSGADVLSGVDADVLVTGEMSHHAALRATMLGQHVVTVFHSNSERRFLDTVLRVQLAEELERWGGGGGGAVTVLMSTADRDPFEVVDVSELT